MNRLFVAPLLAVLLMNTVISVADAAPFSPIPTPFNHVASPIDPDHFTFVVTGDNRSTGYGQPMPACFTEICREIGYVHPAFTMWTGDVIEGYGDSVADANAEYDVFLSGAALTASPVYNTPGNHEFALDPKLLPVYRERMGDLYGSFDYGNSHFVVLNSCAVEADTSIHVGNFDPPQWAWLEADLKSHQSAKHIFVFLHHYPFGPPDPDTPKIDSGLDSVETQSRFHAMMVKYGVRAVYAGHNHIYYHTTKDGVEYYISGGAGAPLDASPDKGGFLHYLVVHVDDRKLTTDILQPYHLAVDYPDGDGKGLTSERAWITNTEGQDVNADRIVLRMALPPDGKSYKATGAINYKNKKKAANARIVSVQPVPGTAAVDVTVSVAATNARTTEVIVAAE